MRPWAACLALSTSALASREAHAWVLPEHVAITSEALKKVRTDPSFDPAMRSALESVDSRLGLCTEDAMTKSYCVSLAALPALAGDHSCTPRELAGVLTLPWVKNVVKVSFDTERRLAGAGEDTPARALLRRKMHLQLQDADRDYVSRATLDHSHFVIARESEPLDLDAYLRFVLAPAQQASSIATYANFHVVALRLADLARRSAASAQWHVDLLARAMLAESFALHFLEDSFSSGHFVGHWGSESTRLGSHDTYCAEGVEAIVWNAIERTPRGSPYRAHGDAFLGYVDLWHTSDAVGHSLLQVLTVATDEKRAPELLAGTESVLASESYDTCADPTIAPALAPLASSPSLRGILAETPMPSPREPPVPRVRAEKGAFVGAAAAFEGGYGAIRPIGQEAAVSRFRAGVRAGFGGEGLAADSMNSQFFVELGFTGAYVDVLDPNARSITGWSVRVRGPGLVSFADGIPLVLVANSTRAPAALSLAATAASGGFFGLWRSQPLPAGLAIQMSLLRDVTFGTYVESDYWRRELLFPFVSIRRAFAMTGTSPGQATDLWLDVGGTSTWSSEHRSMSPGLYLSLSVASRLFPAGVLD